MLRHVVDLISVLSLAASAGTRKKCTDAHILRAPTSSISFFFSIYRLLYLDK